MKKNEFVAGGDERYNFKMGRKVASGLSGFVAGFIFVSIVWGLIVFYMKELFIGQ